MPAEVSVEIIPSDLVQIVEAVFATMLNLGVHESHLPWFPGGARLTAGVRLTGDWNGAVLVECDWHQARTFAGRYLGIHPPAASDEVACDFLGELANMIGGNLKSVLARGTQLSAPFVVDGSNSNFCGQPCGSEIAQRTAFHCGEGDLWITVLTPRPLVGGGPS